MVTSKVLGDFPPLRTVNSEVPVGIEKAVSKALEVEPENRFANAGEFQAALKAGLPQEVPVGMGRKRSLAAGSAVLVVVALAVLAVLKTRAESQRALWAAQQLAEVENLIEDRHLVEALALAQEVEAVYPEDTTLARLLPEFSYSVPILTDPPGARVFIQTMDTIQSEWEYLGETPLEGVRFAGLTSGFEEFGVNYSEDQTHRLRFEMDGFQTRELFKTALLGVNWRGVRPMDTVRLLPIDPEVEGMVQIPGFTLDSVEYAAFFMDRYEVTNRDFKEFVDAGGYRNPEFWTHPFLHDGRELSFEEAMTLLKDETGRSGPSTWRLGSFPDGQADYPVGGVSWYEAAAFAQWAGKVLPATGQWVRGRRYYRENSHVIVPRSNLGGDGPRPVGQNDAMTTLGVYDLSGNVREWCYNQAGVGERATRGGAWPDAPFHTGWVIPKPAFDRDPTNGFRLIRTPDEEEVLAALRQPVERTTVRDYWAEEPVSDAEFGVMRRLYAYDPYPLNAEIERADTSEHWVREKVAFDLPYGERGGVVLYVPTSAPEPFQPIVYWGGSGLLGMRSIDEEWVPAFDYMVMSGRIVAVPIFKGAYERDDANFSITHGSFPGGWNGSMYRDYTIQWVKEVSATIDYLESRQDVDAAGIGYFGFSFGGNTAPLVLAVEPRIRAAVTRVGGLWTEPFPPEIDPFNFVPRVHTPILMINGEFDIVFPYETAQLPMFEGLGTPPEDKFHYVSPSAHLVPEDEVITRTLNWFDKYLGEPGGG